MASKRPRKLKSSSRTGSKAARSSRTRVSAKRTAGVKKKPATAKKTAAPKRVRRVPTPGAASNLLVQGADHAAPEPAPPASFPGALPTPPPRSELLVQAKAAAIPSRHRMTLAQLRTALARLADQPAAVAASSDRVSYETAPTAPPALTGLPWRYGVTELVAMPVDPVLVHVYWELTPDKVSEVRAQLGAGWDGAGQVLRAYDVAGVQKNGWDDAELVTRASHHFDFDTSGDVGNYYIHLWRPEQTLIFELGWRTHQGRFVAATRSNLVSTPRNAADGGEPEQWATARRGGR